MHFVRNDFLQSYVLLIDNTLSLFKEKALLKNDSQVHTSSVKG